MVIQWDTAGQERYRTITNAYYKGADGIIIVFDICNKVKPISLISDKKYLSVFQESFLNVASWMKEVEKHSGEDVTVMVLANKADCPQEDIEVFDIDIKKFEEENKLKVMKVSAKTGLNVDESFLEMTKRLIVKKNNSSQEDKKKTLGLKKLKEAIDGQDQKNSSMTCCSN